MEAQEGLEDPLSFRIRARRVGGLVLRHLHLIRGSVPRIVSQFAWVTVNLLLWGFITVWLGEETGGATVNFTLVILSALVFWDMFVRAKHAFSISFLEEVWSRNVLNLFSTPLSAAEMLAGFAVLSFVQALLAFVYVSGLAMLLYALNIFQLGLYIAPFLLNILLFGWAIGTISVALVMRFGPAVEELAYFIPFVLLPFSAVYHPASVFPQPVRVVAELLPTMHLFEGMRAVLSTGALPWGHLLWASGLNLVALALAGAFFGRTLAVARRKGLIARLLTD